MKLFAYQFAHDKEVRFYTEEQKIAAATHLGMADITVDPIEKEIPAKDIEAAKEHLINAGLPKDAYDIKITYKQKGTAEAVQPVVIEKKDVK